MISVSRVSKSYGSGALAVRALDDVSLSVGRGEIFGVVGQSGAGKSTLIRTINSLERPDSGSVSVDGREMTTLAGRELREARHNIGMIFQHFNLLSSRTVQANVELSLEITGAGRTARRTRALEILELVGLHGKATAYRRQRQMCIRDRRRSGRLTTSRCPSAAAKFSASLAKAAPARARSSAPSTCLLYTSPSPRDS